MWDKLSEIGPCVQQKASPEIFNQVTRRYSASIRVVGSVKLSESRRLSKVLCLSCLSSLLIFRDHIYILDFALQQQRAFRSVRPCSLRLLCLVNVHERSSNCPLHEFLWLQTVSNIISIVDVE